MQDQGSLNEPEAEHDQDEEEAMSDLARVAKELDFDASHLVEPDGEVTEIGAKRKKV